MKKELCLKLVIYKNTTQGLHLALKSLTTAYLLGYPMADYLLCGSSVELLSFFKLWLYVRINHSFFLHSARYVCNILCFSIYFYPTCILSLS